ncbi:MAG: protein translocase SEC61 complex subunit gamma [Candidatus Micrarchaeota archaeon]
MEYLELLRRCWRILLISRKPTPEEYSEVAKVAGIGIIIFGTVGFVIALIFNFIG